MAIAASGVQTGPGSVRPASAHPVRSPDASCSFRNVRDRLQSAGLRPTRQRMALGWLLFGKGDRHVTAEALFEEARGSKTALSLATVYNTLRQFSEASLLREIAVYGSRIWYDTNTGPLPPPPSRPSTA